MIRLRNFPLFSLTIFLGLASSFCSPWSYTELDNVNGSCYPKDSCTVPRDLDDLEEHNCDCGSLCGLYRTCCIDSPFLNLTNKIPHRKSTCRTPGPNSDSVFMVDTCNIGYRGPSEIKKMCEQEMLDRSDPLFIAPVTNPRSQTTYRSVFCAICNNEDLQDLTMWQILLDCSPLTEFMKICTENREFVLNNIVYIKEKSSWGLWSWDKKTDWKFRLLPLSFRLPISLKNVVKECRSDLISECASNWRDTRIKRLCKSYMGAVYFPYKAYRNVHCAICNHVRNMTEMSCHQLSKSPFRSPTALSFGVLLDVDLKDGSSVGTVNRCSKGEVYDPFSKKCRSIQCPLPGYAPKDGKCVQSS